MIYANQQELLDLDKLLVLPLYIQKNLEEHPLTRALYIAELGYFSGARSHYRERPQGCHSHIFIYCAEGEGWVEIEDQPPIILRPHMMIMIPAGKSHRYGPLPKHPWSMFWFHSKGSDNRVFAEELNFHTGALTLPSNASNEFIKLFNQCYTLLADKAYSWPALIQASQLTRYLISMLGAACEPSQQEQRMKVYLERAIIYMKERLESTVSLPKLAMHVGISKQHLTHLFNQVTGHPPIDYYLRMKIQRSCELLDLTDWSIKEICCFVGIRDPYYFSRIFKKMMGISPTQYRRIPKG